MKYIFALILLVGLIVSVSAKDYPKREMRAVWIATVENIDWPSTKLLTTDDQKAEMIGLLDSVKAYNMNTIVFQIRPDADALYASELETLVGVAYRKTGPGPESLV